MQQFDIVIIGAGTAGLSAAIYGLRAGKSVVVLEEMSYGGQIINTPEIENYPGIKKISGFEFATGLYEQAKDLGAIIKYEQALSIESIGLEKLVKTGKEEYSCKAVILATGAKNRPLGVPREKEMIGKGISYCATCDGAFFRGKNVAVVGGGNTALEDAGFLSNYCEKVYLVHRRDSFRGDEKTVKQLQTKGNVEFVLSSEVTALLGEKLLEAITIRNKETGEEKDIPVKGLFIAIGQMPANDVFSTIVDLDEGGYIKAGEDCKTNVPGVFAAGDCRTKTVRQLTTAAADGAVAALAACQMVEHE